MVMAVIMMTLTVIKMTMRMTFAAEMTRRKRIPDVLTVSSSALTRASVLIVTIMIMITLHAKVY